MIRSIVATLLAAGSIAAFAAPADAQSKYYIREKIAPIGAAAAVATPPAAKVCGSMVSGKTSTGAKYLVHFSFAKVVPLQTAVDKCNSLTASYPTAALCEVYNSENQYSQTGIYLTSGATVVDNTSNPAYSFVGTCK